MIDKISNTEEQFISIIEHCRDLFAKKTADYGTAWRILRMPTLTDQIYIKAQRIRSIQEAGEQKVKDPIRDEFIGMINYSVIALIQNKIKTIERENNLPLEMDPVETMDFYDTEVKTIKNLLTAKNHDYGEAWKSMRISSMTDLILQKLLRIKQIEDNGGKTLVSEGITAGYQDIVNYSVFCLILMNELNI